MLPSAPSCHLSVPHSNTIYEVILLQQIHDPLHVLLLKPLNFVTSLQYSHFFLQLIPSISFSVFVCLSVSPSDRPSFHPSIHLSSLPASVLPSVPPSCLPACLPPSLCLSVCLSVYLSIYSHRWRTVDLLKFIHLHDGLSCQN